MLKKILLFIIFIHRKFTTLLDYGSCRFYPTCSTYVKINISHNNILIAIYFSIKRILSCNQYSKGGIDYPKVKKNRISITHILYNSNFSKNNIDCWLIYTKNKKYLYWVSNFTKKAN